MQRPLRGTLATPVLWRHSFIPTLFGPGHRTPVLTTRCNVYSSTSGGPATVGFREKYATGPTRQLLAASRRSGRPAGCDRSQPLSGDRFPGSQRRPADSLWAAHAIISGPMGTEGWTFESGGCSRRRGSGHHWHRNHRVAKGVLTPLLYKCHGKNTTACPFNRGYRTTAPRHRPLAKSKAVISSRATQ